MSTFAPARLRCRCGAEHDIELADGLHISARPDIRQAILDGTFHRFACPTCGHNNQVEKLLAYTDFPRRHWFTVIPDDELPWRGERVAFARQVFQKNMAERAAPQIRELAPAMVQRAIFGLASLRDKIVCFDADLDDRLVEALKLQLLRDLGLVLAPGSYFYLTAVSATELTFEYGPPDTTATRIIAVPRSMLDELAARSAVVQAAMPELWDDIVVDYRVTLVADASVPTQV